MSKKRIIRKNQNQMMKLKQYKINKHYISDYIFKWNLWVIF